jgi:TorA maturation chaperone TorD
VAAELEYLYLLTRRAGEGDVAREVRFLEKFLLPWFPEFCKLVVRFSEMPFYGVLAAWTERGLSEARRMARTKLDGTDGHDALPSEV